jgi:hypothetical protein
MCKANLTFKENTEVYNIVCDSLSLAPRPNNGTIRLPFKTVGLHAPEQSKPESEDTHFSAATTPSSSPTPASSETTAGANNIISISPIEATPASDPNVVGVGEPRPSSPINVDKPNNQDQQEDGKGKVEVSEPTNGDSRPTVSDEGTTKSEDEKGGFAKWLKEQVEKMKGWIHGIVDGVKDGKKEGQ